MGRNRGHNVRHNCPICGVETVSRNLGTQFCIRCSYKTRIERDKYKGGAI